MIMKPLRRCLRQRLPFGPTGGLHAILVAVAIHSAAANCFAQAQPSPLSGVRAAAAVVSFAPTGKTPYGVSATRLQTILELRVRQAGLRILTDAEVKNETGGAPAIVLEVTTLETKNAGGVTVGYTFSVAVNALAWGRVPFNQAWAPLELWEKHTTAVSDVDSTSREVERVVGELLDAFLNAWLAANPK